MSTASVPMKRHALGLPRGSVRATHVLGIVGILCAILLVPARNVVPLPPYLIYLLFIALGHYFAHRSGDPNTTSAPLGLPRGSIRLMVVLALAATIGWKLYSDEAGLLAQYEASLDAMKAQPTMPLLILGGFFLGIVLLAIVGRDNDSMALRDFEAWLSIVALVGILVSGTIHIIILPSLESQLSLPYWEGFLGAVVAFYFGERC
jgi:hypothetical protein